MRRIVKKKYCKLIDFHVYDKRPIPGEKEDNYGLDESVQCQISCAHESLKF